MCASTERDVIIELPLLQTRDQFLILSVKLKNGVTIRVSKEFYWGKFHFNMISSTLKIKTLLDPSIISDQ